MPKKNLPVTVTMTVDLDEDYIRAVLTNAFEMGIGYWAQIAGVEANMSTTLFRTGTPMNPHGENSYAVMAMTEGCVIKLQDPEQTCTDADWTLTREKVIEGLKLLLASKDKNGKEFPRRHANALLSENDDVETADVLVQLAVLGEIVFG